MNNCKYFFLWIIYLIFLAFLFVDVSFAQFALTGENVYRDGEVSIFSEEKYQEVLTRQNSCTIYLTDFIFSETLDGDYLVQLTISFKSSILGKLNSEFSPNKYTILFSDVIKNIKKNEPIELSLKDKKLVENEILTYVTDIEVDLRLIRKKRESDERIFRMIKPLMDIATKSNPVSTVFTSYIDDVTDPSHKDIMLFSSTFRIPHNIFEYDRLSKEGEIPFLRNNERVAIIAKGQAKIPKLEGSAAGVLGVFFNDITKFVAGKKVIKDDDIEYKGLLKLYFTKDTIPILPISINEDLKELIRMVENQSDPMQTIERSKLKIDEIHQATVFSAESGAINNQTSFSICSLLNLMSIYLSFQAGHWDNSSPKNEKWIDRFHIWTEQTEMRGLSQGYRVIGIRDIYKDKLAKIFLPYSLDDELILSFFSYQRILHKALARDGKLELAKPFPFRN